MTATISCFGAGGGYYLWNSSLIMLAEKSGHMARCALVALALARQDGSVQSPAQENLFLTRWLATLLKQRCFPRDVAPDIEWMLKQCRHLGVRAKLASKLDYLWRSCTGELSGVRLENEYYPTLSSKRLTGDFVPLSGTL